MSENDANDSENGSEPELNATTILSESEERAAVFHHVFDGETQAAVGDYFDVSASTISKIVREYKAYSGPELELAILNEFGDGDTVDASADDDSEPRTDGGADVDALKTGVANALANVPDDLRGEPMTDGGVGASAVTVRQFMDGEGEIIVSSKLWNPRPSGDAEHAVALTCYGTTFRAIERVAWGEPLTRPSGGVKDSLSASLETDGGHPIMADGSGLVDRRTHAEVLNAMGVGDKVIWKTPADERSHEMGYEVTRVSAVGENTMVFISGPNGGKHRMNMDHTGLVHQSHDGIGRWEKAKSVSYIAIVKADRSKIEAGERPPVEDNLPKSARELITDGGEPVDYHPGLGPVVERALAQDRKESATLAFGEDDRAVNPVTSVWLMMALMGSYLFLGAVVSGVMSP